MNTPKRGNIYLLFILLYQLAISFMLPFIEEAIGKSLFNSQLSIIPLHLMLFILPFIFYLLLTSQSITEVLPLRKINFTNIGLIVLMCITIQPLMMVLSGLSSLLFPNNVSVVMSGFYATPLLAVILATSLTPAISEEITLRGVILTNYENVPIRKAALLNGILFGIIHLDLQQFLYAFLLGFMFAYFVYYTKSILASIIAHFTVNSIQTFIVYLSFSMIENPESVAEISTQASSSDLMAVIISLSVSALIFTPVCIVIFRAFAYYNKQRMVTEALNCNDPQSTHDDMTETPALPEENPADIQTGDDLPETITMPEEEAPRTCPTEGNRILNWPLAVIIAVFISFTVFTVIMQRI